MTDYLASGGAGYSKWGKSGWEPIGIYDDDGLSAPFDGSFDGNRHKISGLWIDRSGKYHVGLFGFTNEAEIYNLGVEIAVAEVIGANYSGGLVGIQEGGSIENCYTKGNVIGGESGGLVVGNSFCRYYKQ